MNVNHEGGKKKIKYYFLLIWSNNQLFLFLASESRANNVHIWTESKHVCEFTFVSHLSGQVLG
jgi:hypothetical protein